MLVEHIDETLLLLLLLFYAGEGVTKGVAGCALLFVGGRRGFAGGALLEVVGFADDFEWLGVEFLVVELEVDTEQGVLVLAGEHVNTGLYGYEFTIRGEVCDVFEGGGTDEGYFTAGLAVIDECGVDLGLSEVDGRVFGGDVDQERSVFHNYKVSYKFLSVIAARFL